MKKRKAILIGFEYENGKKLPGIIVDIYKVYHFLKKISWEDSEIVVFTDITKDYNTEILKVAIVEKTVDSEILTFIEDLKEKEQYIEFKSHNHYNNFQSYISNLPNYAFIYYSGHSKNENLILPNNALISLDFFRDMLKSEETFLVMDCCEGGINLPFILHENLFRLEYDTSFIKSEMICISSSLDNEKSITSRTGSLFTRYLFEEISNPCLYNISKNIKSKVKFGNILVSQPKLHYIFNWFYKFPNIKITLTPHFIEIKK